VTSLALGKSAEETEKSFAPSSADTIMHVHNSLSDVGDIDVTRDVDMVVCGSMVPMMPSLDMYLASSFQWKHSTVFSALPSCGTAATGVAYSKIFQHLQSHPTHSGLAVSSDLGSFYYANTLPSSLQKNFRNPLFPKKQQEALFVQDAHFPSLSGDGASASYLVGRDHPLVQEAKAHGKLLPFCRSITEAVLPHSSNLLGYTQDDSGFRIVLDPHLEREMASFAGTLVNQMLRQRNLKKSDITEFLFHVGGQSLLKGYRDVLGLPDHSIYSVQSSIAEFGNMSASSSVDSLRRWLSHMEYRGKLRRGERFMHFTAGPGVRGVISLWEIH
jgi:predicted naringenin-chalcone synthase